MVLLPDSPAPGMRKREREKQEDISIVWQTFSSSSFITVYALLWCPCRSSQSFFFFLFSQSFDVGRPRIAFRPTQLGSTAAAHFGGFEPFIGGQEEANNKSVDLFSHLKKKDLFNPFVKKKEKRTNEKRVARLPGSNLYLVLHLFLLPIHSASRFGRVVGRIYKWFPGVAAALARLRPFLKLASQMKSSCCLSWFPPHSLSSSSVQFLSLCAALLALTFAARKQPPHDPFARQLLNSLRNLYISLAAPVFVSLIYIYIPVSLSLSLLPSLPCSTFLCCIIYTKHHSTDEGEERRAPSPSRVSCAWGKLFPTARLDDRPTAEGSEYIDCDVSFLDGSTKYIKYGEKTKQKK